MNQLEVKEHILSYVGIGSNLGNREENFRKASQALSQTRDSKILRTSPLYLTEPHTITDRPQPWYLNAVFEIQTSLNPLELFVALKKIEKELGRTDRAKWAPRIVDLDLLFYGNQILESEDLCVPHREIAHRRFVLQPLYDLTPEFVHPVLKKTISVLLKECDDRHGLQAMTTPQTPPTPS